MDINNREELLRLIRIYANNVEVDLQNSNADAETKRLVRNIAEETASLMSAIISSIKD